MTQEFWIIAFIILLIFTFVAFAYVAISMRKNRINLIKQQREWMKEDLEMACFNRETWDFSKYSDKILGATNDSY